MSHDLPSPDVRRHDDLLIPVGDETVAATRYEPADVDGPRPVILNATPYRKDDRVTFGSMEPALEYFAHHGYEAVAMDLPGTGASSGTKEPFDGGEGEEVAAVIEWLADRGWSTNEVGMYGLSYGAWTQYAAAAENPDPLKAIVPVAISPSVYQSSWSGGAFNLLKRATWPVQRQADRALPPSRRDPEGRWAEIWHDRLEELREGRPWLFAFRDHPTPDAAFWRDRTYRPEQIRVPALFACGYRDVHTGPVVEFFEEIEAPKRLLLGPWRHTFPEKGREVAIDFRRQAVEWFDRFLKGEENGALDGPTITYWTERDGGWKPGVGVWRPTERWPTADDADAGVLSFALSPDGLVEEGAFDGGRVEAEYEYDHTVGIESLDRVGSLVNTGVDTGADDARSLSFETGPLAEPVELTGTGVARVRLSATTAEPLVAVRLVDVDPRGSAKLVTAGHLKASHRNGHETPEPLDPGEEYGIEVPLKPKSHVFEAGHRIRASISAAYFPRALPPREHGSFTVRSVPDAPSVVAFPGRVHAGGVSFEETLSMDPPDERVVPAGASRVHATASEWETTRNHTLGTATIRTARAFTVDLPEGELTWENGIEASVAADDPTSAYLRDDITLTLDYDTETVRVEASGRTSEATQSLSTAVFVDDSVVFEETWRR